MVHRALRGSTVVGTAGFCLNMVLGLVYAWSLFAGPLQDAFGGTAVDTSRIFSVSMMGLCLGHLASGWLSPRTSPRFVMLLAAGFAAVGFAGSALAASYGWLTVSYGVCCGFATGMGANCVLSSVLPWFSNRKGAASGVLLAGVGLGPLVLGPVVGALIAQAGWRTAFAAMAVVAGGMLAAGSLVLRQPSTGGMLARANAAEGDDLTPSDSSEAVSDVDTPNAAASLGTREMLRTRAFWTLFCWISLVSSGGLALISNAVPAALDVMGTREAWAVMAATGAMGALSGFNSVGRLVAGGLWDRLGSRGAMAAVSLAFAVSMVLCAAAQELGSFPLVVAGFLLLGAAYGGSVSVESAFVGQYFGLRHYAMNYAVATLNVLVASCIGPTISGFSRALTGGYLPAYVILLAVALLSLGLAVCFRGESSR